MQIETFADDTIEEIGSFRMSVRRVIPLRQINEH